MADAIKELLDALRERLKNPIFSAFILSWTALNWRILLLLFVGTEGLEFRIARLDAEFGSVWYWVKSGSAVLLAIVYVKYMPHISKWAYGVQREPISAQRTLQVEDEKTRLEGELELAKLRKQISEEQAQQIVKLSSREEQRVMQLAESVGISDATAELLFRNNIPDVKRLARLQDWERQEIRKVEGLEQIDQLTQIARDLTANDDNGGARDAVYELVRRGQELFEKRIATQDYPEWDRSFRSWRDQAEATVESLKSSTDAGLFLEAYKNKDVKTPGHSLGGSAHGDQLKQLQSHLDYLRREFDLQV